MDLITSHGLANQFQHGHRPRRSSEDRSLQINRLELTSLDVADDHVVHERLGDLLGDMVGNQTISSFLNQNYFRFGSRYDWRELLERGTGSGLNPEFLISKLGI